MDQGGGAHADGVLPIVRLVKARLAELGHPELRVLAAQKDVPYGSLQRYQDTKLAPLKQMPRQKTMKNLADALGIPLARVQSAFSVSIDGYLLGQDEDDRFLTGVGKDGRGGQDDGGPVGRSGDPDAVLNLDDLTPEQRAQIRAYAEFIRSQNPAAQ